MRSRGDVCADSKIVEVRLFQQISSQSHCNASCSARTWPSWSCMAQGVAAAAVRVRKNHGRYL